MKKAFTLAEILITLTIIGVVAALIVPAISNLRPNKNKTAYLQVYDTISQTVKSLASNSRLYPVCNNPNVEDNVNCSQYPLLNTSRPLDNQYNNAIYQGDRKLCSLIKFMVAANGRVVPADPKGNMYTKTRSNLLKKDKEIENQEIANQLDADRIFLYKKCDGTAGNPCSSDELWKDNIGCTDRWAEVKQCLRDIDWKTVTYQMIEFCGLKINRFEVVVSADAMTVKLLDGAAQASLTWKPWFFIQNSHNYYLYKTIRPTSDFSCTIPVGGTTCSIPISQIRDKEQENFPNSKFIILHYPTNHSLNPQSWFSYEETIRPFFDNTFLYKYKGGIIYSAYSRAKTDLSDFFKFLF